jgi:hypothetical protein
VATSTEIPKVGAGSRKIREIPANADVAQLVEHFTRKEEPPDPSPDRRPTVYDVAHRRQHGEWPPGM